MLKLNFSQTELRHRIRKLLGNIAVDIHGVHAAMGGKFYHVLYQKIDANGFREALIGTTFTVWEVLEAQVLESQKERLFSSEEVMWAIEALNLNTIPASMDELKQAFRHQAKTHHPDAGGDEKMFRYVDGAYRHLCLFFESL